MQCTWIIAKPPPNPQSMEKLSSKKSVPGAKKIGNCCFRAIKLAVMAEQTVGWRGIGGQSDAEVTWRRVWKVCSWGGDRKEEKEVRGVMGRGSEATEAKLVLILPSDWRWRRSQRPLPSSKEGMGPNFSPSPLPCMEPGTEGYLNICYIIKVG